MVNLKSLIKRSRQTQLYHIMEKKKCKTKVNKYYLYF